jgi:azurin
MRSLLNKTVRPVPASEVISSANFPPESQGNFLICNSIGFLGMKQYTLDRNAESGEVNGTAIEDLLVSEDRNFRPTDVVFGDDGAAYVSDWANVIIGHMQHNIRDPNRDHAHGRIFRMTAKGRPLQESVKVHGQPIEALLKNLEHPIDGVRHRTRIELAGRDTEEVIKATRKWMTNFDPRKAEDAHHLVEALWVHQQHNVKNPKLLTALLSSPEPHARRAATTAQHYQFTFDETGGGAELKSDLDDEVVKKTSDPSKGIFYINTVKEQMRYDTKDITVKAGQEITLTFTNDDYMPHNLLIVENGSVQEIAMQAMALGEKGFDLGFRPENNKILAGTKMLDNDQTETITWTPPAKGKYEFVCTFPGHWTLMRGVINVK